MAQEVRVGVESFFFSFFFLNFTWGCESAELLESEKKNCDITVLSQLSLTFAGGLCVVCLFWECFYLVFVIVYVGFLFVGGFFVVVCFVFCLFFGLLLFLVCFLVVGGRGGEKKDQFKDRVADEFLLLLVFPGCPSSLCQ